MAEGAPGRTSDECRAQVTKSLLRVRKWRNMGEIIADAVIRKAVLAKVEDAFFLDVKKICFFLQKNFFFSDL